MKKLIIIILFITSWQSVYCDKEYGTSYKAVLDNEIIITIDLFENGKYHILAQKTTDDSFHYIRGDLSLGRFIKKRDSIIFIDELTNYRFVGIFIPGYPLGSKDLEVFINNKGDYFLATLGLKLFKSDYSNYKNSLKTLKHKQDVLNNSFTALEKASTKEKVKLDFGRYSFIRFFNDDNISLIFNKDKTYRYSLWGSILSEGKFNRKGNVLYLVDNSTNKDYKIIIIEDNEISVISLPLFLPWANKGKQDIVNNSENDGIPKETAFKKFSRTKFK